MKKTEFLNLLQRKFHSDCLLCDKERKKIGQAFSERKEFTIKFHPDVNPQGALTGWHLNIGENEFGK